MPFVCLLKRSLKSSALHICVAGAHGLIELRLGEVERGFKGGLIFGGTRNKRRRGRSVFPVQSQQAFACFVAAGEAS